MELSVAYKLTETANLTGIGMAFDDDNCAFGIISRLLDTPWNNPIPMSTGWPELRLTILITPPRVEAVEWA